MLQFTALAQLPHCPEPIGEQAYAHPEICDQFFLCVNGTLSLETCENGLIFTGKGGVHNHCAYNWNHEVDCDKRHYDRKLFIELFIAKKLNMSFYFYSNTNLKRRL